MSLTVGSCLNSVGASLLVLGSMAGWSLGALGLALGLIGGLLHASVEWGAWALVTPGRRHDPARPEVEPGPWEPIATQAADGTRLAGALRQVPGTDGRTVLLLHGFGEDRAALFDRAQALAERGLNVALLDSRGRGASGGFCCSFGGREADDLRAWVNCLTDRLGPTAWLAAWGRSMGAAVALRAATTEPRLRALILEACYDDLTPTVAAWLALARLPRWLAPPMLARAGRIAGVSLTRPRPLDLAPLARVPVYLLHGGNDRIVPTAATLRLHQALRCPLLVYDLIPDAGHVDVVSVAGPALFENLAGFLGSARTDPLNQASTAPEAPSAAPDPPA